MKILFIVQGEGRGHLTQAISLEKMLRANGHEVVEILVGKSNSRSLPAFFNRAVQAPVHRFLSPNFLPAPANKRVSLVRSVAYNLCHLSAYARSILFIHQRIKQSGADLVVNFYELLTGLTYGLLRPQVPQVSIGHQYLFLHPQFSFPHKNPCSLWLLRFFTRLTSIGAARKLALSFRDMPACESVGLQVVPPLLRSEVLACTPTAGNYLHGYMVNAGFGESVRAWHETHRHTPLHFFWDRAGADEVTRVDDTLSFHRIDDVSFLRYMAGCKAYATTAGFESVCEAIYLGKPLLMVPAHIEQDCNAHDAALEGAGIVDNDFNLERLLQFSETFRPNVAFRYWVRSAERHIMQGIEAAAYKSPCSMPAMSHNYL